MKISEILEVVERMAPLSFQEEYDNAGIQVGAVGAGGCPADPECTGVLVTLDVNEAVVDEAVAGGCNLILAHHPLIYKPLHEVTGQYWQQRCVIKALCHGVAIYSAHTNLDNAEGGVNWKIAEILGLQDVRWLLPKGNGCGSGAVGVFPEPVRDSDFLKIVQDRFSVECVRHTALDGRFVRTVALCGGSGASLVGAAREAGADCYVTGELGYHQFFDAEGLQLYALGHYQSEQFTMDLLIGILRRELPMLRIAHTSLITNPICYSCFR